VIERRRLPRTKVPVKVLAEDADVGHDCTVENLNTLGACISFDATTHELKFSVHTGIDAPESSQLCRGEDSLQYRCGAKAANDLDAFIAGRPVNCLPVSVDRYGRTVATCSVGRVDLGDWLVRNGLALDWPEYSKRKYEAAQREAEQAGRGI
jgi:Staphylococcal nuclease homologue